MSNFLVNSYIEFPDLEIDKDELKAYWKFNESSGDIINQAASVGSTDSLGSAADLQTTGIGSYDTDVAPFGYSMTFDGAGYGLAGSSVSQFNFMHSTTATWTVVAWIDMTGDSLACTFSTAATPNTNVGVQAVGLSSNTYRCRVTDAGGVVTQLQTTDNFVPQDNAMHMYVITYNQSLGTLNMKISVDDGTKQTANKTVNAPTDGNAFQAMYIGSADATNFGFAGTLAEMSIWNRVLTDSEITQLYNSGNGLEL